MKHGQNVTTRREDLATPAMMENQEEITQERQQSGDIISDNADRKMKRLAGRKIVGVANSEHEMEERSLAEPLVELSGRARRKLGAAEQLLYVHDQRTFSQLYHLRQENPNLDTGLMMRAAARYLDSTYHLGLLNEPNSGIGLSDDGIRKIGRIYERLGESAPRLDYDIFDRGEKSINEITEWFDLADGELAKFEPDSERDRSHAHLVQNVWRKLQKRLGRNLERYDKEERQKTECDFFLVSLVNNYRPNRFDADSVRGLAQVVGETIAAEDYTINNLVTNELDQRMPANEILNYVELYRALDGMNEPNERKLAWKRAADSYFQAFGMAKAGQERFIAEVLPVLADDETLGARSTILNSLAVGPRKDETTQERFNFLIQKILPDINSEMVNDENLNIHDDLIGLYDTVLSVKSAEMREKVYADFKQQILPFVCRSQAGCPRRYAVRLAGRLILTSKTLQENHANLSTVEREEKVAQRIEELEENMMPIAEQMTLPYFLMEEDLLDTAYERRDKELLAHLRDEIFPMINAGDEELGDLLLTRVMRGEGRLMDFAGDCVKTKITPREVNNLLMDYRELPTSDSGRLEQNRIDALAIEQVVIPDHGFIHDEDPMAHEMIVAMVNYYDKQDTEDAEVAKQQLEELFDEVTGPRYGESVEMMLNLENYDKMIHGQVQDDSMVRDYDETAIEVLRRLEQNTAHDNLKIPELQDKNWQKLMQGVNLRRDLETNEVQVGWQNAGDLVRYTNNWLLKYQGQYQLNQKRFEAVVFTERVATFALRNVNEQERQELLYDENFKEIVKLEELIYSYDSFSEKGFERFYNSLTNVKLEDSERLRKNYWKLSMRILSQTGKLAEWYRANGKPERAEMLQSGNLVHELVGMFEAREPKTLRERANQNIAGA